MTETTGNMRQTWENCSMERVSLPFNSFEFSTEKNAQCESGGLSFIWGNMRTAAWEIAPQIALRNCSKEVGEAGKISIHMIFDEGEYVQSSTYFSRRFLLVS